MAFKKATDFQLNRSKENEKRQRERKEWKKSTGWNWTQSNIYYNHRSDESPIDAIRTRHPATFGLTRPNKWLFYHQEKMKRAWRVDFRSAGRCKRNRKSDKGGRGGWSKILTQRGKGGLERNGRDTPTPKEHEPRGVTCQSAPWGNDSHSQELAWDNGTRLVPLRGPMSSHEFGLSRNRNSHSTNNSKYLWVTLMRIFFLTNKYGDWLGIHGCPLCDLKTWNNGNWIKIKGKDTLFLDRKKWAFCVHSSPGWKIWAFRYHLLNF